VRLINTQEVDHKKVTKSACNKASERGEFRIRTVLSIKWDGKTDAYLIPPSFFPIKCYAQWL
jgi:hypothetical protein